MKRVVHISSVHTPFDSRILYRECRWIAKEGYDVFYIVPADVRIKRVDKVTVIGIQKAASRWGRPMVWLGILRQVVTLKPDILHFHDPELLFIVPFVRLCSGRRIKIVYDVHEYFIESLKDKFWIPAVWRKPAVSIAGIVEYFFGKWVDGQVFVVEDQIRYYKKWKTLKTILHNYPDLENFNTPAPGQRQDSRFTLVHIGSLYERRGILTMLETMHLLQQKDLNIRLVIGGVFESPVFKEKVESFISDKGLGNHITILGWVDYTRLMDYIGNADAAWLVLHSSSQYSQGGVSTKQLEAMLASLPVVCSDVPLLSRFVHEAACGIIVKAKDAAAHAAAIEQLYQDRSLAKKMGARGRRLVLGKYVWQNEVKKMTDFYKRLLT